MVIDQGDIYWIELVDPVGSGPGCRRPVVVVQNNVFNRSRIRTTVVCTLTSNLRLADRPGNVMLGAREAGLPRQSVANVTQVLTVDKGYLGEKVGTLSRARVREILRGISQVIEPREPEGRDGERRA